MFKEPIFKNIKEEKSAGNEILSSFSPEQQDEIEEKRKILSSLAFFIGKDFEIPVELNIPGKGWHWDFKNNVIRIDPVDLLEKPMDYLRFVISHEGGHRRISRTDFIPLETWKQPGFSFMMNSVEDPRDNNFLSESYSKFTEQMSLGYEWIEEMEEKTDIRAKEKLGYIPRFKQAGYEYIRMWYKEEVGEEVSARESLPDDVKEVVEKTLSFARSSWLAFPTKDMADGKEKDEDGLTGEESIVNHAKYSYEINLKKIWPEFEKLIKKDMEDQKMEEFMKGMTKEKAESSSSLPQDLKDELTPEEQKKLEKAIEEAIKQKTDDPSHGETEKKQTTEGNIDEEDEKEQAESDSDAKGEDKESDSKEEKKLPIDLDSLSDELKQKIKEYMDSLPDDKKKEIEERAKKTIKDFEGEINKDLEGKLSDNPEKREEGSNKEDGETKNTEEKNEQDDNWSEKERKREEERIERRKKIEEILESKEKDPYREALEEVSGMIDNLTSDLRDVFTSRKIKKHEAGYRSGRRWNIRKRIQEKIAGVPLLKTESREQVESESEEMDYAITLMIDLSGSMRQSNKIQEAFKSTILLSETLENLGIKFEIVGFQDILLEFKNFDDEYSDSTREKMNQILLEANDNNPGGHNNCQDNDDGRCLLDASKNLAEQLPKNKFIIVLSDGAPAMDSGRKSGSQLDREMKEAVAHVVNNTDQKLIGIGILSSAVKKYYEENIPNVSAEKLTETLGVKIREIIENY